MRLTQSCTGRQPLLCWARRTSVHRVAVGAGELQAVRPLSVAVTVIKRMLAVLSLSIVAGTSTATVIEAPPTYSDVVGEYFCAYAGSSLQRLVLRADKTGSFVDAGHEPRPPAVYSVKVLSFREGKLRLRPTPTNGGVPVNATGEGSYFEIRIKIPATPHLRARKLVLHRERVVERLLAIAKKAAE